MKINSLIIDSTNSKTDLCFLGEKYPTDKSPYAFKEDMGAHKHPYTAVYDFIFSTIRFKENKIAEIGILNNKSMLCWRDYFPKSELFGFDFANNLLTEALEDNVENAHYDFMDIKQENSINSGLEKYGPFDIIIEDSTHQFEDQIRFVNIAYKYIKPGGILIVEDIFRSADEQRYCDELENVSKYFSTITFVLTEHKLRYSPGWNNDKLLFLIRNRIE